MRRFSLSTVLFALALVFQSAAVARLHVSNLSPSGETVAAAHCAFTGKESSDRLPDGQRQSHDCFGCTGCFVSFAPVPAQAAYVPAPSSETAFSGWAVVTPISPPSAKARSHQARAPPALS